MLVLVPGATDSTHKVHRNMQRPGRDQRRTGPFESSDILHTMSTRPCYSHILSLEGNHPILPCTWHVSIYRRSAFGSRVFHLGSSIIFACLWDSRLCNLYIYISEHHSVVWDALTRHHLSLARVVHSKLLLNCTAKEETRGGGRRFARAFLPRRSGRISSVRNPL